jgi:hypothetical protein
MGRFWSARVRLSAAVTSYATNAATMTRSPSPWADGRPNRPPSGFAKQGRGRIDGQANRRRDREATQEGRTRPAWRDEVAGEQRRGHGQADKRHHARSEVHHPRGGQLDRAGVVGGEGADDELSTPAVVSRLRPARGRGDASLAATAMASASTPSPKARPARVRSHPVERVLADPTQACAPARWPRPGGCRSATRRLARSPRPPGDPT